MAETSNYEIHRFYTSFQLHSLSLTPVDLEKFGIPHDVIDIIHNEWRDELNGVE